MIQRVRNDSFSTENSPFWLFLGMIPIPRIIIQLKQSSICNLQNQLYGKLLVPRPFEEADKAMHGVTVAGQRKDLASGGWWYRGELFTYSREKLTWHPKMEVWKMIFLFKQVIFKFSGSMLVFGGVNILGSVLTTNHRNWRKHHTDHPRSQLNHRRETVTPGTRRNGRTW